MYTQYIHQAQTRHHVNKYLVNILLNNNEVFINGA